MVSYTEPFMHKRSSFGSLLFKRSIVVPFTRTLRI